VLILILVQLFPSQANATAQADLSLMILTFAKQRATRARLSILGVAEVCNPPLTLDLEKLKKRANDVVEMYIVKWSSWSRSQLSAATWAFLGASFQRH